jgi:hypothetical protein
LAAADIGLALPPASGLAADRWGARVWRRQPASGIVPLSPHVTGEEMKQIARRSTIRSLYHAFRERRWNRDRSRRIATMLDRERATLLARAEWLEAMAIQLAEIWTLPEAVEPRP